jgi:hypothetical protein
LYESPFQIRRFKPGFDALGILVDFLTRAPPFDSFRAGPFVTALKHQLARGHHVSAFRGEALVGYCGWLPITSALGERWLAGEAELEPAEAERSDAVALTIVRVEDRAALRPLIRASRKLEAGKPVYFRRDYANARARRWNRVANLTKRP